MTTTAPPNWWQRNWKWIVPVLAAAGLALFAAFFVGLFAFIFGLMKSSEPYQAGMARARASTEVRAALGEPIAAGYFVQGDISTAGAGGEASLAIPLSGPRGKATLYVEGKRAGGQWRYSTLAVRLPVSDARPDGHSIDLLPPADARLE